MTPFLPELDRELTDLIVAVIERVSMLHGGIHSITRATIARLIETMHSYYSNLISGHYTTPRDIDKALKGNYSDDPAKRELQTESVAHIKVYRLLVERLKFKDTQSPLVPRS
ncbi:MAG TPA: hypothetical protein VK448_08580 [Dissulfurispiraceae bacterium]|nr:hypothetical protein [Dissulfurispiraceae bacterium]